jgi:hypothetical protein
MVWSDKATMQGKGDTSQRTTIAKGNKDEQQ